MWLGLEFNTWIIVIKILCWAVNHDSFRPLCSPSFLNQFVVRPRPGLCHENSRIIMGTHCYTHRTVLKYSWRQTVTVLNYSTDFVCAPFMNGYPVHNDSLKLYNLFEHYRSTELLQGVNWGKLYKISQWSTDNCEYNDTSTGPVIAALLWRSITR